MTSVPTKEGLKKCKLVFISGKDERYCIFSGEIRPLEEGMYKLPDVDIAVDRNSYAIFRHSGYKAFLAYPKMLEGLQDMAGLVPVYNLKPLGEDVLRRGLTREEKEIAYEQPKKIGQGSYGEVRGYPTERIVVKTSKNDFSDDVSQDIVKEIAIYRLLGEITCLPQLFEFEVQPVAKLVFEMGEKTLRDAIDENRLSLEDKKLIMFRLVKCLRSISSQGVIHADIKPANCILLRDGKVQIIDWGLSQIDKSRGQTVRKIINGSPIYEAPELIGTDSKLLDYTREIDIYSLGATFFELFSGGETLIEGEDMADLKHDLLKGVLGLDISDEKEIDRMFTIQISGEDGGDTSEQIERVLIEQRGISPDVANLLSKMLVFNPKYRIDYDSLVLHPFFQDIRREAIPKLPIFINNMPIIPNIARYWPSLLVRPKILTWMRDVCRGTHIELDTMCLAFQIIDLAMLNSLEARTVPQKVACSALSLASKCLDAFELELEDLDDDVPVDEIVEINEIVLRILNGNLLIPTIYSYYSHDVGGINDPGEDDYRAFLQVYLVKNVYAEPLQKRAKNFILR